MESSVGLGVWDLESSLAMILRADRLSLDFAPRHARGLELVETARDPELVERASRLLQGARRRYVAFSMALIVLDRSSHWVVSVWSCFRPAAVSA